MEDLFEKEENIIAVLENISFIANKLKEKVINGGKISQVDQMILDSTHREICLISID